MAIFQKIIHPSGDRMATFSKIRPVFLLKKSKIKYLKIINKYQF
jgi:hypothetical protein